LYVKGQWQTALVMLEALEEINSSDGPTIALKRFMIDECDG